ncbi:cupin domain-containing protein [Telmatospirillum sp.]|uniref:cupin domain-containing protein n=1 Tax=Telmatospirillum sp. TaxID=2079197 RepID=UPI002847DC7D|nr:cupin domain-containing protein [Telmatospirillum sp.]MDR3435034.1 cupin domain-containing protein [Telmatospirillum sp.]
MNKAVVLGAVAGIFAFATVAQAEQLFSKDNLKTWDREKVAGGEGTLYGKFSFTRNDAKKDDAIKEIGWMTLQPGAAIGPHKHDVNEDTYIIVSGEGTFTDTEGKESVVKAGDITIARKGESHALKNTGKEPLVFLDVIAQQ